jgi:hypothetical protein
MQLRLTRNDITEEELSGFSDFLDVKLVRDENVN